MWWLIGVWVVMGLPLVYLKRSAVRQDNRVVITIIEMIAETAPIMKYKVIQDLFLILIAPLVGILYISKYIKEKF